MVWPHRVRENTSDIASMYLKRGGDHNTCNTPTNMVFWIICMVTQGKRLYLWHFLHASTTGWGPLSMLNTYQDGYSQWGVAEAWKWPCRVHCMTYFTHWYCVSFFWPYRTRANTSDMARMHAQQDGDHNPCNTPTRMVMIMRGGGGMEMATMSSINNLFVISSWSWLQPVAGNN